MKKILLSIQKEYTYIFDKAFSDKYKNAFNRLDINGLKKFILKEVTTSQELDRQLNKLLLDLNKFWSIHTKEIINAIKSSNSYKLLLPIQRFGYNMPENLKSLGIYFDTILMVDPLHFPNLNSLTPHLTFPPNHPSIIQQRLVLLEHAANVMRTIPFMKLDEDHPLFLIIPELLNFEIERNHEESASFMSQLFKMRNPMGYDEFISFIDDFKDGDIGLKREISNNQLLAELEENFQSVGDLVLVMDPEKGSISVQKTSMANYGLASTLRTLLGRVEGAIYAQRSTQVSASILQVDPVIYSNHLFLHEWIVKRLVKDYENHRIYSMEEQSIAMGLTSNEVKFLTALSGTELKKIRENGQLESLRNELRTSRASLQNHSYINLQKAAKDFSDHLIEVVNVYGEIYKGAVKKSKNSKIKTSAMFAGSATLGIASLALPQYFAVGLAATGIGLSLGGKSLTDIYKESQKNKKEILQLEQNPISLLYGASKRNKV